MNRPFRRVAFGFLLVLLDFRFNAWDLLPDAVGFFLVWSALGAFRSVELLRWARAVAGVLALLALPALVGITWRENVATTTSESGGWTITDSTATWEATSLGQWIDGVSGLLITGLAILLCLGIRVLVGAETPFGVRAYYVTKLIAVLWLPVDILGVGMAAWNTPTARQYSIEGLAAAPLATVMFVALVVMFAAAIALLRLLFASDAAVAAARIGVDTVPLRPGEEASHGPV